MKKFLKSVEAAQSTLISAFIEKKDAPRLSNIGGTNVSEQGDINFDQYSQMIKNTDAHSKEWKRYAEDPGKIVLEKNFFLNYIKSVGSLFMFRPFNDQGETRLIPLDSLREKIVDDSDYVTILFGFVFLIFLEFMALEKFGLYAHVGWVLITACFVYYRMSRKRRKKSIEDYKAELRAQPSILLGNTPYSIPDPSRFWYVGLDLSIDYKKSEWQPFLNRSLQSMVVLSARMKGKISWLLFYGNDIKKFSWDLAFWIRSVQLKEILRF